MLRAACPRARHTDCFHLSHEERDPKLPPQGDCRPLGGSRCQRMWVSHYFVGEEHKDAKGRLDLAGRRLTRLIKCSNGLLGRRRSQSVKCLGPFLGLLHGKKCEILLTFCNNLPRRKNYKAIWEATPRPASVVFGGGFPPLEKQARNSSGPLETGGMDQSTRPGLTPKGGDTTEQRAQGRGHCPLLHLRMPGPPQPGLGKAQRQGPWPGQSCASPRSGTAPDGGRKGKGSTWTPA